jgi:hypothetical protein
VQTQHRDVIVNIHTTQQCAQQWLRLSRQCATGRARRSIPAATNAKFSDAHLPSCLLDGCIKINPITAKKQVIVATWQCQWQGRWKQSLGASPKCATLYALSFSQTACKSLRIAGTIPIGPCSV